MRSLLVLVCAIVMAYAAGAVAPTSAEAHRSGCHTKHECPSDHATYRWGPKHLLCVKPTSDKRNSTFKLAVRYEGLNYFCKR